MAKLILDEPDKLISDPEEPERKYTTPKEAKAGLVGEMDRAAKTITIPRTGGLYGLEDSALRPLYGEAIKQYEANLLQEMGFDKDFGKEVQRKTENALHYERMFGLPPDRAQQFQETLDQEMFGGKVSDIGRTLFEAFKQASADKPAMMLKGVEVWTPFG